MNIELNAAAIFEILNRHAVDYVLIGGYAAQLHGASKPTSDADVVPATARDNLARLAAALRELDARIRKDAVPDGLPFDTSAETLAGMLPLNLQTRFGDLDITFAPDGTGGYEDLVRSATPASVAGLTIHSPRSATSSAARPPPDATRTSTPCPNYTTSPSQHDKLTTRVPGQTDRLPRPVSVERRECDADGGRADEMFGASLMPDFGFHCGVGELLSAPTVLPRPAAHYEPCRPE